MAAPFPARVARFRKKSVMAAASLSTFICNRRRISLWLTSLKSQSINEYLNLFFFLLSFNRLRVWVIPKPKGMRQLSTWRLRSVVDCLGEIARAFTARNRSSTNFHWSRRTRFSNLNQVLCPVLTC